MAGRRRRGRTQTRKARPTLSGILRIARPGVASVETSEGTFPVAKGGIREGMHGDEVVVSLVPRGCGGGLKAVVRSVLQRSTKSFLGTFAWAEPLGVVMPLDARLSRDFFVLPEDDAPKRLGVSEGDVVSARVLSYPTRDQAGVVTLERRVGASAELDVDIEGVIASYGLASEFSPAACAETDALDSDVSSTLIEVGKSRRDLRGHTVVTVDPADARDFDDAVSAARLSDGGYEVGVHIADVTSYVAWGSSIDIEARQRTCSVYLVDRVLPMLPERLSNDLCSLRPGEDRLCMSVLLTLDATGMVVAVEATPSLIHSRARLSYEEVDAFLEGRLSVEGLPLASGADPVEVARVLTILDEVAHLRIAQRARRGAIDFASREAKVTLDADGRPKGVVVRRATAATSLVEEAMLMANEAVAGMLVTGGGHAAFRVHERPSPDDMAAIVPVLRELCVLAAGEVDAFVAGDPSTLQAVLARAAGTSSEYAVNALLIRSQHRAMYLPHNEGHYALGAPAYCHFTSPIRRYPDVIVHRALKAQLARREMPGDLNDMLAQLCRSCSDQERVADAAARASQRVKMAQLYAGRIGERVAGIVVGVERYGLYVMDDETCAEGLLPTRALGDEWFRYDEGRLELVGEESGRAWRLGQRVAVEVRDATPSRGQIDFVLA